MTEPDLPPEQALLERVAQFHGVTITAILGRDQTKSLRIARAEAMVRMHYQLGFNFAEIGRLFDNRTCQTVRGLVMDHEGKYGALERLSEFRKRAARPRRAFTDAEFAIAREMNASGTGKAPIARRLRTSLEMLERECERRGIELRAAHRGGRSLGTFLADPLTDVPIGSIPPGHPLYEIDQQMLRARNTRHVAVGGWLQSSIADIV